MKKFTYITIAFVLSVFTSCTDKEEIEIIRHHTLTYVINTQSMYDDLGITSETTSNYLNNNYNVGVYTFIYDSDQNLVATHSTKESSLGTITETFKFEEGSYTIVTYETLVGSGNTPSWSGEDKLTTLSFNDNSSSDYHYILGTIETNVSLVGGDKTELVSPAATRHLLTLNIGTQSMYDIFGRSDYERLLSKDYNFYVGVTSLIYDNSGQFVDSVCSYVKTFQSIQQKFSLCEGIYSIVTVETLVDGDNNYTSDYWKIDNIQNYSSVVLLNKTEYSDVYWDGVVGTSNCTVSVGNSNHSQNVIPSAIGSLVNVTAANFDKSDYSLVVFYTKNAPNGIMLSPNTLEKYYYSDYEKSNYWKGRGYLGNLSSYEFSESEGLTLYILESGSINWCFGVANESYKDDSGGFYFDPYPSGSNIYSFQDGQIYYAYIRYRGDEKGCDANLGTFNEIVKWVNELEPIVNKDALFGEPYTTWGGTVASVKSYMSGYRAYNNGTLNEEANGMFVLTYYGKYKEDQIRYWFTSQTGGLRSVVIFFDSQKVGEDELSKSFTEMGYIFIDSNDNYSLYLTKDLLSYVEIGLNSNNYWYVRYSNASSSSRTKSAMDKTITELTAKEERKVIRANCNFVKRQLRQCEKIRKVLFK